MIAAREIPNHCISPLIRLEKRTNHVIIKMYKSWELKSQFIDRKCKTFQAKVQDCEPCEILKEYEYNEMYYDSSYDSYDSNSYSDPYGASFGGRQSKIEDRTKPIGEFNIQTHLHCPTGKTFARNKACQLTGSVNVNFWKNYLDFLK